MPHPYTPVFETYMSRLARLPQTIQHRGWRRKASAGLNRLIAWLEAPLAQQQGSAAQQPLSAEEEEAASEAPALISPAYTAFQQMPAQVISRYINLQGCQVLEIGGAQACISAQAFLDAGAARVVVTGLEHILEEQESDDQRLVILRADGLNLLEHVEAASFDVVFGLSIIEHIPHPRRFLEQVRAVLKAGGIALFEGYPLWSSALGHHLWVPQQSAPHGDQSGNNYLFTPIPGITSINPIPDWGHLLMNETEMRSTLQRQSLPDEDISRIIDWIYHSPEINRIDSRTLLSAYGSSELTILEANTRRQDVPADVLTKLRERHGKGIDYGLSGIVVIMTRDE